MNTSNPATELGRAVPPRLPQSRAPDAPAALHAVRAGRTRARPRRPPPSAPAPALPAGSTRTCARSPSTPTPAAGRPPQHRRRTDPPPQGGARPLPAHPAAGRPHSRSRRRATTPSPRRSPAAQHAAAPRSSEVPTPCSPLNLSGRPYFQTVIASARSHSRSPAAAIVDTSPARPRHA